MVQLASVPVTRRVIEGDDRAVLVCRRVLFILDL